MENTNTNTNVLSTLLPSLMRGPDDFVIRQIFATIEKLSCGNGILDILKGICKRVPYIILLIIVKHYVSDSKALLDMLKSVGWKIIKTLLYRRKV